MPNADHEELIVASGSSACTSFGSASNGQTYITMGSGTALYSYQSHANLGAIVYNNPTDIYAYGDSGSPVSFCIQLDGTFSVRNTVDGTSVVQLCGGIVYLNTPGQAASNGCTEIILASSP